MSYKRTTKALGWRPNDPKKLEYISSESSFYEAMKQSFGKFPITIRNNEADAAKLIELAARGYDGADELIEALLDENDSIIVEERL